MPPPIAAGLRLGTYVVDTPLGAGGMGVVYRAFDTNLHRPVAIKFLSDALADPAARRRFQREAQTASSLNHPHIVTVHDAGEFEGRQYLVTEFVDGGTLRDWTQSAERGWRQTIELLIGVADGLAAAHDAGILHRDIKPENILITKSGYAKLADFGLAKLHDAATPSEPATVTDVRTRAGAVLGTVAYMSPEQALGRSIDARSDIFSFGVVLYEVLSDRRPFAGASDLDTMHAIVHNAAEPLPEDLPLPLRMIVEKALEKDPADRFQSMRDMVVDLRRLVRQTAETARSGAAQRRPGRARPWRAWGAALAVLAAVLLAAGFLAWRTWRAPGSPDLLQAASLTTLAGMELYPSFSPDGNHVAFTWTGPGQDNQDIYVQLIGSGSPLQRTTDPLADYNPVWSPDGRWIAFFRGQPPAPTGMRSRELRVIPPLGGMERKLADIRAQDFTGLSHNSIVPPSYLAWSPDSRALIVTASPGDGQPDALFVVSLETGERRQLTRPNPPVLAHISPALSPDGGSLVFLERTSWRGGELRLLPLGTDLTAAGEPRRLTPPELRADYPAWMPDGREIIFSAKGGLWRLTVRGENAPSRIPYIGEDGLMPVLSRSQSGKPVRLGYVRSFSDTNFWRLETSAPGAPSSSAPAIAIASTKAEHHLQFSPDGRRVVFASYRSGDAEIWIADADGSRATQLTSMKARETMCPVWSPDGQLVAFSSNQDGEFDIYVVPAAGGKPRRLTSHPAMDLCPRFSRDGRSLYFGSMRSGDYRVWKMPADGGDAIQVTPNQGGMSFESKDGSLYYNTASIVASIWRLPPAGGEPVKVLDGIVWFNYTVIDAGIYYIDRLGGQTRLQFLDFATGTSSTVARNLGEVGSGLAVSPDGKTILFTRVDAAGDDLMLVENFR